MEKAVAEVFPKKGKRPQEQDPCCHEEAHDQEEKDWDQAPQNQVSYSTPTLVLGTGGGGNINPG